MPWKRMLHYEKKWDDACYAACLLFLLVSALCGIWMAGTGKSMAELVPPCLFHAMTGFYCPGCGGTRAVMALLRGDVLASFIWHPIVPCAAFFGAWFVISQTACRVSRGRLSFAMHAREVYPWAALFIIILNCAAKNILHLWGLAGL